MSSMREVNQGTIIDTQSWYKVKLLTGLSRTRAELKLVRRGERVYGNLSSRRKKQMSCIRTIHWNFENLVKIYHDITAHQYLIDPRQMASLKEPSDEKEDTSAVLLQSGVDERWWSDSVECHCYLRNVQSRRERIFGEPNKGPPKDQSRIHQFGKKVLS